MNAIDEKHEKILVIYANPSGFGFVVMEGPLTVLDKGIVRIRPIDNKKLLERIRILIKEHEPRAIVTEDITQSKYHKAPRTKQFLTSVRSMAKRKNIKSVSYSRDDIRNVFEIWKARSKFEIAEVISQNLDSFKHLLYDKPKYPKGEPYIVGVFDAASLGITHYYVTT